MIKKITSLKDIRLQDDIWIQKRLNRTIQNIQDNKEVGREAYEGSNNSRT